MPWRAFIAASASRSRKFCSTKRLSNRVSCPPARWISPSPRCSCSIAATLAACTPSRYSPTLSYGRGRVHMGTVLSSTPTMPSSPSPSRPETVTPNTASPRPVCAPSSRPNAPVSSEFRVTAWVRAASRSRSDCSAESVCTSCRGRASVRDGVGPASSVGPGSPARCSAQNRRDGSGSLASSARACSSKLGVAGTGFSGSPARAAS